MGKGDIKAAKWGLHHCLLSLFKASERLVVKEGCTFRTQLPEERFSIDSDNFFLFNDENGNPKMCYRILIRYMGFPQDGYKLHKIDWL
jgi:hypothetical protein